MHKFLIDLICVSIESRSALLMKTNGALVEVGIYSREDQASDRQKSDLIEPEYAS